MKQQPSSSSFLSIFTNSDKTPLWEPLQCKPEHEYLLYQGQFYSFTGTHWVMNHYELYPDILVLDGEELLYVHLQSVLLKRLKPNELSVAQKYGLSFQRGSQRIQLFTENVDKYNIWHDYLKRLCILPNFNKRHSVVQKVKNSNNYFDCYKYINGLQYQVRIVDKNQISNLHQIVRELRVLRHVNHQGVQRLLEVYEDKHSIYMLFETFLGHTLKSRLQEFQILNEKQLADVCYNLLGALSHIHYKNIIHKDIRPENIIIPNQKYLQNLIIANFASAEFKFKSRKKKIFCPGFMAPELFSNRQYDEKIDVFSLGIIFYGMFFLKYPFEGKDYRDTQMLNEKCDIIFEKNNTFSKSAIDLLKCMLQKDPKIRISSAQALKHQWFINKRLNFNRSTMGHPTLSTIIEKSEFDQSQQIDRSRSLIRYRLISQESRLRVRSLESIFTRDISDFDGLIEPISISQKISYLNSFPLYRPSKMAKEEHIE